MVPEKEPSSHARSSLSPLGLLGVLAFSFILRAMTKKSKRLKPGNPQQDSARSISPQPHAGNESAKRPSPGRPTVTVEHIEPPPKESGDPNDGRKKKLSRWKIMKRVMQGAGLAVLVIYTTFAGLQWCAMNSGIRLTLQQLADNQVVQAAQLTVDGAATMVPDSQAKYIARVTYKICNSGNSVANEVGVNQGGWTSSHDMRLSKGTGSPQPNPNGFSVAPHACTQETTYDTGIPEIIDSGRFYYFSVVVAYRDIFTHPAQTGLCLVREPTTGNFYPCPYK